MRDENSFPCLRGKVGMGAGLSIALRLAAPLLTFPCLRGKVGMGAVTTSRELLPSTKEA